MHTKKTGTANTGSYQNYFAGGKNKSFDASNYSLSAHFGQSMKCQKCKSDYMKFAVDGFCQDCQQKVEFIVREHPNVARAARNQNREVAAR